MLIVVHVSKTTPSASSPQSSPWAYGLYVYDSHSWVVYDIGLPTLQQVGDQRSLENGSHHSLSSNTNAKGRNAMLFGQWVIGRKHEKALYEAKSDAHDQDILQAF